MECNLQERLKIGLTHTLFEDTQMIETWIYQEDRKSPVLPHLFDHSLTPLTCLTPLCKIPVLYIPDCSLSLVSPILHHCTVLAEGLLCLCMSKIFISSTPTASEICHPTCQHKLWTYIQSIYQIQLLLLFPLIITVNHKYLPGGRDLCPSQTEKEFWVYFRLFMACSRTVLSKAIQKFLLVMKLASY